MLVHSGDDILKEYLGGEGVAMVNYRLHIWPIPAVNLQTAAAFPQSAAAHTCTQSHMYTQIQLGPHIFFFFSTLSYKKIAVYKTYSSYSFIMNMGLKGSPSAIISG